MREDFEPAPQANEYHGSDLFSAYRVAQTPETRIWETVGIARDVGDGTFSRFKLMTYNVLSQTLLELNSHVFDNCEPSHLLWESRIIRLFNHIFQENPDILCLQEVEAEHLNLFNEGLKEFGYFGIYKKKTGVTLVDGCAIYIKEGAFELVDIINVEFYQRKVSIMDHNHVGIIAQLRPCSMPNSRLVVANTHLLCEPKRALVRLAQLRLFLAEIDRVSYEFNGPNSGHLPIILTGDLNSQPDSTIVRLLEEGEVSKNEDWDDMEWKAIGINDNCQHLSVYVNRNQGLSTPFGELEINNSEYCNRSNWCRGKVSLETNYLEMFTSKILSHPLHLVSVYDTRRRNKFLTHKCRHDTEDCECMTDNVDYMFYNMRSGLRPLERLRLAAVNQLPNEFFGSSDHQSLVVIFELNAEKPY